MSENTLIPVSTKEKIETALEFFHSLKTVTFSNDHEYENGVELCKKVKTHIKEIDSDRKDLVKPFNLKVSEINGECKGVINKLENAERVLKNGMSKYYQEKEQKRIADQKRVQAEIEEKKRKEQEKARKEREKEESYRDQGKDELADKAAARAETSEAVSETIVSPIIENTAKVKGTSFKTTYSAEITNKKLAIEHMLMNDILLQYLSIDVKGIEKLALAQKGSLNIEGIHIVSKQNVSIRS